MCFASTPTVPTPDNAPPVYMHNTYLDNTGSGNPNFTGSQNELAAGFAHASPNATALQGGGANPNQPQNPSTGGQGIQTPVMGPPGGMTPGLVTPRMPGGMGGVFAGAVPNTGAGAIAAK